MLTYFDSVKEMYAIIMPKNLAITKNPAVSYT